MGTADALLAVAAFMVFIWGAMAGHVFGMLIAILVLAGVAVRAARRRRSA